VIWRTPCSKPQTEMEAAAIDTRIPSEIGSSIQRVTTER
jgi:hypothetical protein